MEFGRAQRPCAGQFAGFDASRALRSVTEFPTRFFSRQPMERSGPWKGTQRRSDSSVIEQRDRGRLRETLIGGGDPGLLGVSLVQQHTIPQPE